MKKEKVNKNTVETILPLGFYSLTKLEPNKNFFTAVKCSKYKTETFITHTFYKPISKIL
jgi:hypothetical protein